MGLFVEDFFHIFLRGVGGGGVFKISSQRGLRVTKNNGARCSGKKQAKR